MMLRLSACFSIICSLYLFSAPLWSQAEDPDETAPGEYSFEKLLYPVAKSPRCMNCHLFPFPGGKYYTSHYDMLPSSYDPVKARQFGADPEVCKTCHKRSFTGVLRWRHPGGSLLWYGKSMDDICENFRTFGDPESVKVHLTTDRRVKWAIKNRQTPDDYTAPPPPVDWIEWKRRVIQWVDKGEMRCR